MLVLTRKPGEKVIIGGNVTLTVVETEGGRVWLAFDAPEQVHILRGELRLRAGPAHARPASVRLGGGADRSTR